MYGGEEWERGYERTNKNKWLTKWPVPRGKNTHVGGGKVYKIIVTSSSTVKMETNVPPKYLS
jgi:hypothetical protein